MLVRMSGSSSVTKMCGMLRHESAPARARSQETRALGRRRSFATEPGSKVERDERCLGVVLVLDEHEHVHTGCRKLPETLLPESTLLGRVLVAPQANVGVLGGEHRGTLEVVVVVDAHRRAVLFEQTKCGIREPRQVTKFECAPRAFRQRSQKRLQTVEVLTKEGRELVEHHAEPRIQPSE